MTLPFDSRDDLPRSIYRAERDERDEQGCISPLRTALVRSLRVTLNLQYVHFFLNSSSLFVYLFIRSFFF